MVLDRPDYIDSQVKSQQQPSYAVRLEVNNRYRNRRVYKGGAQRSNY